MTRLASVLANEAVERRGCSSEPEQFLAWKALASEFVHVHEQFVRTLPRDKGVMM
jgi:hypothetical protein